MGAILFDGSAPHPSCVGQYVADVSEAWMGLFNDTSLIYGIELLVLVAIVEHLVPLLQGCCVWFHVDNNVLPDVARGDANTEVIAMMVAKLWYALQKFPICAWFSRASSALNPADLPTRGRELTLSIYRPHIYSRTNFFV